MVLDVDRRSDGKFPVTRYRLLVFYSPQEIFASAVYCLQEANLANGTRAEWSRHGKQRDISGHYSIDPIVP